MPKSRSLPALCACVSLCLTVALPAQANPDKKIKDAVHEAVRIILDASRSDSARERANAIEAMKPRPDRSLALAQSALNDENRGVRFIALTVIGQQQARELGPLAAQKARTETDLSTRAAAIFAAHRCGENVDITPLSGMLLSRDPTVRGNAAMLLGEIGDASALPMLADRFKAPMARASSTDVAMVRMQIAEAMLKLGDNEALQFLRAKTADVDDEIQIAAARALGRAGDRAMAGNLNNLMDPDAEPIQVRLGAAEALAMLNDTRGLPVMIEAAKYDTEAVTRAIERYINQAQDDLRALQRGGDGKDQRTVAQLQAQIRSYQMLRNQPDQHKAIAMLIRAQAALAMASSDTPQAKILLVELLKDPEPTVRLAAAAGVLQSVEGDGE